jgi:hypothetical protein
MAHSSWDTLYVHLWWLAKRPTLSQRKELQNGNKQGRRRVHTENTECLYIALLDCRAESWYKNNWCVTERRQKQIKFRKCLLPFSSCLLYIYLRIKIHETSSVRNIFVVLKSMKMLWMGHVACTMTRNESTVFTGIPRHRYVNLKETECDVNWIELAQDSVQ